MQYNTNHETNGYSDRGNYQSNSYNGGNVSASRNQQHVNAPSGEVIANIRMYDDKEAYKVKVPTESSVHPVVTLGQLKSVLPIHDTSKYSYFFLTNDDDGWMAERNDKAILPILRDKKGRPSINVQCKPAPQIKK